MQYLKNEQFLDLFQKHIKKCRQVENDEKWSNNGKKAKVDEKSRKLIGCFVRSTLENVKKGGK
jgi:hypothetical protein